HRAPALDRGPRRPGGGAPGRADHRRRHAHRPARHRPALPVHHLHARGRRRRARRRAARRGRRLSRVRPAGRRRRSERSPPVSAPTAPRAGATANEDDFDLDRDASRTVRRRSLRLLGNLLSPHLKKLAIAGVLVVISTLGQVAGPALVAVTIDRALPALLERDDSGLLTLYGVLYAVAAVAGGLAAGAYIRQADRKSV